MRRPSELCFAVPLLLASCASSPEDRDHTPAPADVTYASDSIEFGALEWLEVCGASLDYLDRFIELYLAGSASGPISEPIEYYYVDAATIQRGEICGTSSEACARDGVVYAPSPINTHEVVHAVRQLQHGGRFPGARFFEEGIAQLHYPAEVGWSDAFSARDLPAILAAPLPRDLYDPAANLVGVVAHEESFAVAEALVDRSGDSQEGTDIDAIVQSVVGVDLAGLDAMVSAEPHCSAAARMRMLVECAAEPVAWAEAPWSDAPYIIHAVGSLACEDPRTIGPLEGRLWTFATIDIADAGAYDLDVESEDGQRLELTACDEICGEDIDLRWEDARRQENVELAAGRIVVRLSRATGDTRGVAFQLRGPLP